MYASLFTQINAIELWADEFWVIDIALVNFEYILPKSATEHVLAPPVDYWNLHFWILFLNSLNIPQTAFNLRVPYMVYHFLAATLFSILISKHLGSENRRSSELLYQFLYFMFYFFNPIFFYFSIEVRFYSLSYDFNLFIGTR